MKAYFTNLPTRNWLLVIVPALLIAYPMAKCVLPAMLHAVVPEVVRSVFNMM